VAADEKSAGRAAVMVSLLRYRLRWLQS